MRISTPHPLMQLLVLLAAGVSLLAAGHTAHADAPDERPVVRLAVVKTPYESGLIAALLAPFESQSGYRVEVRAGSDAYELAKQGKADLVISHFGKGDVEEFVMSGYGLWPSPVFASELVIAGPERDPAGIRGLADPFEAMRRIASSRSPLVLGKSVGRRYLADILLAGAGDPDREGWYAIIELSGDELMRYAESKGAYTILKGFEFSQFKAANETTLGVMVGNAPLMQRIMAIIRVNPARVDGVNAAGAEALENYLLSPHAQALIAAFREPVDGRHIWAPAARHNHSKGLARRQR